jgi:hypothetical protein
MASFRAAHTWGRCRHAVDSRRSHRQPQAALARTPTLQAAKQPKRLNPKPLTQSPTQRCSFRTASPAARRRIAAQLADNIAHERAPDPARPRRQRRAWLASPGVTQSPKPKVDARQPLRGCRSRHRACSVLPGPFACMAHGQAAGRLLRRAPDVARTTSASMMHPKGLRARLLLRCACCVSHRATRRGPLLRTATEAPGPRQAAPRRASALHRRTQSWG